MIKKEIQKEINRQFLELVETKFPNYEIVEEEGGRVCIYNKPIFTFDDVVEYHKSRHELFWLKNVSTNFGADCKALEIELKRIVASFNPPKLETPIQTAIRECKELENLTSQQRHLFSESECNLMKVTLEQFRTDFLEPLLSKES